MEIKKGGLGCVERDACKRLTVQRKHLTAMQHFDKFVWLVLAAFII